MAERPTFDPVTRAAHRDQLRGARQQEAAAAAVRERRGRRLSSGIGLVRFAVFVVFVILAVRVVGHSTMSSAWPAAAGLVFAAVVAVHARVRSAADHAARERQLSAESAARLGGAFGPGAGASSSGQLPAHPASDLDAGEAVFRATDAGEALDPEALADLGVDGAAPSLYRRLDSTQTLLGARRLRRMLHTPLLDAAAIRARQDAVRELAAERIMRDQLLEAFAVARGAPMTRAPLFLAAPRRLFGTSTPVVMGAAALAVIAGAAAVAFWAQYHLAPIVFRTGSVLAGVGLLLSIAVHARLQGATAGLRDSYLELEPIVRLAADVARVLLAHSPQSSRLVELRAEFTALVAGRGAARLTSVRRALRLLHVHEFGAAYPVVELCTGSEVQALFALEGSMKPPHANWERVAGALGELEALAALAVDADECGPWPYAEFVDGAPELEIEAGAHPLLDALHVVPNDCRLAGATRLALVTGSNMAGKSTFLRMVALNVVLAQAGGVVRAQRVRLTPLRLRALIHVRDSLADGKSYFKVEVERVREVIETVGREAHVLAVFDELFRGTNSIERIAAGRAIARHLAASGGLFLLATHDHELARLAEQAADGVVAWHFGDEVVDGALHFSYALEPGVSRAHNAIRLLEEAGYPTAIVTEARAEAAQRTAGLPLDEG